MKYFSYCIIVLLSACGMQPLVAPLPDDSPTRPVISSSGRQCSAVVVHENVALTARHCAGDGAGIIIALPEGPLPVADIAQHESRDLALLMTQVPLPPPYAALGPAPNPGQELHVEGYGCGRVVPAMPAFGRRGVVYLGINPAGGEMVFAGVACRGDSGGGVFNEANELVGISSAISKLEDGTPLLLAEPVQEFRTAQ